MRIVRTNHLHDLDLSDAGDGKRDPLSRLHHLAHRVECHHFQRELLDVCDEPPGPSPSSDNRSLLGRSTTSSCEEKFKILIKISIKQLIKKIF